MNDIEEPESFGVETCAGEARFAWVDRPSGHGYAAKRWYLADSDGEIWCEINEVDGKYIVVGGKSYITLYHAKKSVRLDLQLKYSNW